MKADRITRFTVLLLLASVSLLSASTLLAAEPTGSSPSNGLAVMCQVESLAASSPVWYKIPYHKGTLVAVDLTAIDGVYFDVFAPDQVKYFPSVGQSMGRSVPNPDDPIYQRSWQGQLVQSDYILDYYYVRLTNTIGIEVSYRLCFKETVSSIIEPTGASPFNGLTAASCTLQFLNPNAQIWHNILYPSGKELELYLKTTFASVDFDVYTPEQVENWPTLGQPIGRGTLNKNESEYAKSWQGHLWDSSFYYVLVKNANSVQVQYQLCWREQDLPEPPGASTQVPTPRPRHGP